MLIEQIKSSLQNTNRENYIYIFGLVFIWFAMVILVNPIGNFPLNDDWAYAKSVQSVLQKGDFQLYISAANLFSQVWWGALFCLPFGFSFTALRFSSLTLGLIGVLATYGLLKEVNLSPKMAFLGALLVAFNPMYFGLSNTFMTDVPFFGFASSSLYCLIRGLRRNSRLEILMGIILACIALLIRQFGMAIFVAFSFAYVIKKGINTKNIFKGSLITILGIGLQISYQTWLKLTGRLPDFYGNAAMNQQIDNILSGQIGLETVFVEIIQNTLHAFVYLGLFIFPLLIIMLILKLKELSNRLRNLCIFILSILSIVIIGDFKLHHKRMPFGDFRVLDKFGIGPLTLRETILDRIHYNSLPTPSILNISWRILTVIGIVGAAILILYGVFALWQILFESYKSSQKWLIICIVSLGSIYLLPLIIGGFYDRYLLFLIPLSMMLVALATPSINYRKISLKVIFIMLITMLFYGVYTIGATHDYLSWNRARWQALNNLMQEYKITPNYIDGGYEFNGWYLYDSKLPPWWVDKDDYLIAFTLSKSKRYHEFKRYTFERWLPWGAENILVLRKNTTSN